MADSTTPTYEMIFMKLPLLLGAFSVVLTLTATSVSALESVWQNSYQLEAAGKYGEAIAAMDAIRVNDPDDELKLLRRGWLYYLSGSFNESIREYRFAIELNSRSVDARLGVTLPLLAQKRWREAEQNARAALELAPNNYIALVRLSIALEARSNWVAMEKTAATMVAGYPSDATAYLYLARVKVQLGKRDEAIAAYTAVLSRSPGQREARAYLAKK